MSTRSNTAGIIVGGEPRIDFLPPEIKAAKQARKSRRVLLALVVLVMVLCAGGYVFATTLALQSQERLAAEQSRTQELLQEQLKYSDARAAANQLAVVEDARLVGSAAEVLWREYLAAVQGTVPAGVSITTFTVDSVSAFEVPPELTVPLQTKRVASLSLSAASPGLAEIDQWMVALRGLRGYADSTVTSITLQEGVYMANVVLNVNADAFERRFFEEVPEETTPAEGEDDAAPSADGEPATEEEE
ncbi:hypothetical protein [Homoserinimonas sp. A520]